MAAVPLPAKIVIGGLLLSVPAFLAGLAGPRFLQGVRTESFHSVVGSAELGERLAPSIYRAAADAYADTTPEDGEGMANYAQLLVLSDEYNPATLSRSRQLAIQALVDAPSNPGSWLLLCQIEARQNPRAAVACLDHAFALGAYDWYTADRRMSLAAQEWPYLDERLRNKAVSLVLPMWNTADWSSGLTLRGALYNLSFSNDGRQLLLAGFQADRDALRSFNRYIIEEQVNGGR